MHRESLEGYRISPQQEHVWLLQSSDHASTYFAMCAVLIEGGLDIEIFKQAFGEVVKHNEILRTTFHCLPDLSLPVQVINDTIPACSELDLSGLDKDAQAARLETIFQEIGQGSFGQEEGSHLRALLLTLASDRHALFICLPALCGDEVGLENFVREIGLAYARCRESEEPAAALYQYADIAEVFNELLESDETAAGREYWLKKDHSR